MSFPVSHGNTLENTLLFSMFFKNLYLLFSEASRMLSTQENCSDLPEPRRGFEGNGQAARNVPPKYREEERKGREKRTWYISHVA